MSDPYERAALLNHSKPPGKPSLQWFTMVPAPAWFSNGFEWFTNGLQDGLQDTEPSALTSEAGHQAWPMRTVTVVRDADLPLHIYMNDL
jgi:hypothetical protein